ncbi:hypothetical protein [Streptomyces sp. NPDC055056]
MSAAFSVFMVVVTMDVVAVGCAVDDRASIGTVHVAVMYVVGVVQVREGDMPAVLAVHVPVVELDGLGFVRLSHLVPFDPRRWRSGRASSARSWMPFGRARDASAAA